ncbi:ribonuclease H-like domain-containing protein [Tanacetum coccineum]
MDQDSADMVAASKVPMLKPSEFELWRMRIEQYIQMIDYALWEVIENGNTAPKTTVVEGVEKVMPPTTAEEKAQKRLEVKARSTLMIGIPNNNNSNTNGVVYELEVKGMSGSSSSTQNMVFVSSSNNNNSNTNGAVSTTHAVNTANGISAANTQVNASNIDNLSDAIICALLVIQPNNPQLAYKDLQQIYPDDLEEMDLRCQMAMLTMRARRFLKNIGRKLTINGNESVGFGKSKVECYKCHKKGHFAKECRSLRNQDYKNKESTRRTVPVETSTSTALVSCDGLGLESLEEKLEVYKANEFIYSQDIKILKFKIECKDIDIRELKKKLEIAQKEKDGIQFNVDKFENASKSLNKLTESQIVDNCKKGLGYNAVLPPYTGNFMPPTPDMSFTGLD